MEGRNGGAVVGRWFLILIAIPLDEDITQHYGFD